MVEVREITMTMIARVAPLGKIHLPGQTQSMWRKFMDTVLEPQSHKLEDDVVEYLYYYRHDLPPAISIELERHRPEPETMSL